METEYETKVIDIDAKEIEKKLIELGAKKTKDALMRRWVFDWNENYSDPIHEWIRLRDEGNQVTLTFKKRDVKQIEHTKEIETKIEDFDKLAEILNHIPFSKKIYQENKRIVYELNEIEFMIDTWPNLEPHIEIEGKTKEKMEEGLTLLGLKGKEIGDISCVELYKEKGIDMHNLSILKFEEDK